MKEMFYTLRFCSLREKPLQDTRENIMKVKRKAQRLRMDNSSDSFCALEFKI